MPATKQALHYALNRLHGAIARYAGPDPRDRRGKKLASRAITTSRRAHAADSQRSPADSAHAAASQADHERARDTNIAADRHFKDKDYRFGAQFGEAASSHALRAHDAGYRARKYAEEEPPDLYHSISYGRQATCGGCGQKWYIATDSIDLVCPRCGFNSTKYAVTDQPGIYGPAMAAPAPGGQGPRRPYQPVVHNPNRPPTPRGVSGTPRRLASGHDVEAERVLPMDRALPRRPDPRYRYPDTGPGAARNPNYARYADDHFARQHAQDRRLHEHRLRQVFPDWDEFHPHDQETIWNKTYRTGPARHGVGVGHPTNEDDLAGWRDEMNQRRISTHHDPLDLSGNHATGEFDDYLNDTAEQSSSEEWAGHVDRMEQESGGNKPYNPPEALPEGFEEPTQAWREHVRRANQPTQAARYARTDYHGRLCRLREKLASLRQPTMYDDEMMEDGGGMDEMDGGVDYADNVSGIGQDERHGYSSGMADQTRMWRSGHGPF